MFKTDVVVPQITCLPPCWGVLDLWQQHKQWDRWLAHYYGHLRTRLGGWKKHNGLEYFTADGTHFEPYFEFVQRSAWISKKTSTLITHSWVYKSSKVKLMDLIQCMEVFGRLSEQAFGAFSDKYDKKSPPQRSLTYGIGKIKQWVGIDTIKSHAPLHVKHHDGEQESIWGNGVLWVWNEHKKRIDAWDQAAAYEWLQVSTQRGVSKELLIMRLFAMAWVQNHSMRWRSQWQNVGCQSVQAPQRQTVSVQQVLQLIEAFFGSKALFESKNSFGAQYYEEALVFDSWLSDSPAHWCALLCDEHINAYVAKRLVHQVDIQTLAKESKNHLQGRHPLVPRVLKVALPAIDAYEQCAKLYGGLPMNNKALALFGGYEPVELVHLMDQEVLGAMVRSGFRLSDNMLSLLNLKRESAYKISYGVEKMRQFIDNCDALIEGQTIQTLLEQKPCTGASTAQELNTLPVLEPSASKVRRL